MPDQKPKPGRPLKYKTPAEMEKIINSYFESVGENPRITGLELALDLHDQGSALSDYEKRDGFSGIIKKARKRVADCYERDLRGKYVVGAIFALKNMGWSDRQEVAVSGDVKIELVKYGTKLK